MDDLPPEPQTIGRPEFIKKVYTILVIFVVIGLLQLVIVRASNYEFYKGFPLASTFWVLIALWCLLALLCLPITMPHGRAVSYVLGIAAAEALTLSVLCKDFLSLTMAWSCGILVGTVLLTICLYLTGIFVPIKMLPGNIAMLCIGIVAIIIFVTIIMTHMATGNEGLILYAKVVILLYLMLVVVFAITIVHDRRLPILSHEKSLVPVVLLAALFFYMIRLIADIVLYAVHELSIKSAISHENLNSFFNDGYRP